MRHESEYFSFCNIICMQLSSSNGGHHCFWHIENWKKNLRLLSRWHLRVLALNNQKEDHVSSGRQRRWEVEHVINGAKSWENWFQGAGYDGSIHLNDCKFSTNATNTFTFRASATSSNFCENHRDKFLWKKKYSVSSSLGSKDNRSLWFHLCGDGGRVLSMEVILSFINSMSKNRGSWLMILE